ncbi:MAG: DUF2490 domain-containing protein [Cyclobacteriaceae bacterium]|nr:DUF2490 domain-containing protein [Cyclobacteriaceae bacterium]
MNSNRSIQVLNISLVLALMIVGNLQAQDPQQSFQTWSSFNFVKNLPFNATLTVNPEVNRLVSGGSPWHAYSIDNTLEYYPNNSWDVFASLMLSYTKQDEGTNSLEIRPYIGVRWNILKPEKRVFLYLQGKYDFRFFHYYSDEPNSYSGRFRIKPEVRVSLNKKSNLADKNLMLRLNGEYFIQVDEEINERYLSKRQTSIGLLYRHTHAWRYEFRYLIYKNKNTLEATAPTSIDHVAYFIVSWFL